MQASQLYQKLEKDFITFEMSDDWAEYMDSIVDFLSQNFKDRSMGIVCDFAEEINKIFTAVFPTNEVMEKVINSGIHDAMLFVHHPSIWDIRKAPAVFQQMDRGLLQKFKDNRIAIYNLHVPLDNYGEYSTSITLAKALDAKPIKPFAPYYGALAGVFAKTESATVQDLQKIFADAVGHDVSLYKYGDDNIANNIIAVVAGGGLNETIEEIAQNKVNTLITGIAAKTKHSQKAHEFAEAHKINILGGTHYSTEKFACLAMLDYFSKLGLNGEFIEGEPILEDM